MAWQVFRGSEAIRRGLLSRHHLRGASWIRLRQDVYADARLDRDHALACRAALLRLPPGAAIAGPSAAYLHGVEHAAGFTDDVHVLLPATVRADSQPGVRVHHAPMSSTHSGLLVPVGSAAPAGTRPPAGTRSSVAAPLAADRSSPGAVMILAGPPPRTEPAACAWETAVWADPVEAVGIIDGCCVPVR
ncbi:hypothetical protein V2I01_10845 [Micromonospora sp. BRA006-A]|nr:hypothetical protein [Micromonospora sp. BRA006-A]